MCPTGHQDETNFARILSTVEKYAGRRSGETWGELESRSNYKELVSQPEGHPENFSWENMLTTGSGYEGRAQPYFETCHRRKRLACSSFSHRTQDWLQTEQCAQLLNRFLDRDWCDIIDSNLYPKLKVFRLGLYCQVQESRPCPFKQKKLLFQSYNLDVWFSQEAKQYYWGELNYVHIFQVDKIRYPPPQMWMLHPFCSTWMKK